MQESYLMTTWTDLRTRQKIIVVLDPGFKAGNQIERQTKQFPTGAMPNLSENFIGLFLKEANNGTSEATGMEA